MSKEAMKLALEALEKLVRFESDSWELGSCRVASQAIKTLREALAKPDFWEGYVPEPDKRQQALDKKAENARELGLDYEPVQQKPAFLDWYDNAHWGNEDFKEGCWRAWDAALAQRTWVGLTDEERDEICLGDESIARAIEAKLRSKNEDRN